MSQIIRISLASLIAVVSAGVSNGGSPDVPQIEAAGKRTVRFEPVRIIPGTTAAASHPGVQIIPGTSFQSAETRLAQREADPAALPEILPATPATAASPPELKMGLVADKELPTAEPVLPPSAKSDIAVLGANDVSVATGQPLVATASFDSAQPNAVVSHEVPAGPDRVYLPIIIPAPTHSPVGQCATCTTSPGEERLRQYLSVYEQIPFSRSEYEANPGYRQQVAMELVLGQPRPVTIQNTNVTVNNQAGSPFLGGYPFAVSPFYGYGFGRIHGRYGFVYPRYRTYVRW
jgi:hypothetical protein